MKYPLKWYHRFGREFICWAWGHDWTVSAHKKTDKYEKWVYSRCGNPYFESVSQWRCKCRRCRTLTQDPHPPSPFYKWIWYAACAVKDNFKWTKNEWKLKEYERNWNGIALGFDIFHCLWRFPEQIAGHMVWDSNIPYLFYGWIFDVTYWMYELEEKLNK